MTDQHQESHQYWYIPVPKVQFPEAKFHFGAQVAIHSQDDLGNCYCEIGQIIGMQYTAESNQNAQWSYRIRFLKCDHSPWLVGLYDEYFEEESRFVADESGQ